MRAPDDPKLHEAANIIARMSMARPTCAADETVPYKRDLARADHQMLLDIGFEPDPNTAGYRKRCEACAAGKLFPWADRLDAEKVAAFIDSDPRCQNGAWPLALLEETLSA